MAIYQGLAGFRVDSERTYIHKDCKGELKSYGGLQGEDQQAYILKCDACNKIVGEWSTEAEMNLELLAWFEANAA